MGTNKMSAAAYWNLRAHWLRRYRFSKSIGENAAALTFLRYALEMHILRFEL
jgi:hypothetical protein